MELRRDCSLTAASLRLLTHRIFVHISSGSTTISISNAVTSGVTVIASDFYIPRVKTQI